MINTTQLQNSLANAYEGVFPALLFVFALGIALYIFRYEIADCNRDRKKLLNSAIGLIVMPLVATVGYITVQGYIVWLMLGLALLLAFFTSYYFGLFDDLLNRY